MYRCQRLGVRLRVAALVALLPAALPAERTLLPDPKQVRTVGPFVHDVWRIEDGLPQNSISDIAQTRDGYLWLTTFDGLVRFDGARFTVFDPGNTKEMKTSRLEKLFVDRSGALWIFPERTSGESGPIVYSDRSFHSFSSASGFPSCHIVNVQQDREGTIWLKTDGNQLIVYKNGLFKILGAADGIPPAAVIGDVRSDEGGSTWIGTSEGLLRFLEGRFTRYTAKDGLPSDAIGPINADVSGSVWIGTMRGLARFRDERFTAYGIREGLPGDMVDSIYCSSKGVVWIAAGDSLARFDSGKFIVRPIPESAVGQLREDGRGGLWILPRERRWKGEQFTDPALFLSRSILYLLRDDKLTRYDAASGLSDHPIFSFYADHEGSLWIGRSGAGLERLRPSFISTFAKEDGLPNESVRSVYESSDGSLWMGTQGGGVARLQNGKLTTYGHADGLPSRLVWALAEDRNHDIWAGTEAGPARFTSRGFVVDPDVQALAGKPVKCFLETRDGDFWIGTDKGGLYRRHNGTLLNFTTKDGLSSNYIRDIHEDRAGALWLATDDGVTRWKDGRFTAYTTKDGLSNRFVRSIHEDRDGTLWFGTYGGGLNRFRDGRFKVYTAADGLFDRTVSQILEDDRGNFWMSSNRGISRVSKKDLDDFAAGRISTFVSISYGSDDGMKNIECNGGSQPAGWKTRDGKLWFPTMGGVVSIDVKSVQHNLTPPPVIIEQIRINKTAVDGRGDVQLPAGSGELEIRYAGLSFLSPRRVYFRYRLEGFDKEWQDVGNRRIARYTNIPPGRYRFQVTACNNDGVWNERGASFAFRLQPLFYQNLWYYGLCGVFFAASIFGMHRLRIRRLKLREKELHLRVDERTAELQRQMAERQKAEVALRQAEEKYRGIFEEAIVGIFQSNADGRVLSCNPAMARMCGYESPNQLVADLTDLERQGYVDPERRKDFKRIMADKGLVEGFEYEAWRKDGQRVWFSENARAVRDASGNTVLFVGTVEDITERKRVETELLHAKSAAEAGSRAKSEFLANMSHEIRTPMNGILGMTELLLDTDLGSEQREYLAMVKNSADSLLTIINDILDFSKIEAGKLDLDDTEFNLRDAVEDTMKTFGLRADQKGLELACAVHPTVPEIVRGDPTRLRQIINNLVSNAVKFTDRGEVVARVNLESRDASQAVLQFTISDTGIGIPDDKQDRIFHAFCQADSSTTRKYGGTGLGLTVSSRLVSMMGGRIWLESEVARGSRFHFTAAFVVPEHVNGVEPVMHARLEGVRVLVVDDNATNRRILEDMLGNWGMSVTSVDCGAAAIAALDAAHSSQPFTLMITDGHMPEMDGYMLVEELRRKPGLVDAIVMLTSAGQRGDAARCRQLGVTAYLTKPIRQSELREAVLLALHQAAPAATRRLITRHTIRERRAASARRVLIAEDNLINQTLAVKLLEKAGYTTLVASNGREALKALERETFDLVLMDVQMPEMDGFEATALIRDRERATGAHLPIVALTAHAIKGDDERCLAAGMDAYLPKPIQAQQLYDLLESLSPQAPAR